MLDAYVKAVLAPKKERYLISKRLRKSKNIEIFFGRQMLGSVGLKDEGVAGVCPHEMLRRVISTKHFLINDLGSSSKK